MLRAYSNDIPGIQLLSKVNVAGHPALEVGLTMKRLVKRFLLCSMMVARIERRELRTRGGSQAEGRGKRGSVELKDLARREGWATGVSGSRVRQEIRLENRPGARLGWVRAPD